MLPNEEGMERSESQHPVYIPEDIFVPPEFVLRESQTYEGETS